MSTVFKFRLSKEEHHVLKKRSKEAGLNRSAFVRKLIREEIIRGEDLLAWSIQKSGDVKLRISKI